MSAISEHRQSDVLGAPVELFMLDLTTIGVAEVYYFCSDFDVSFGGQEYQHVPVKLGEMERTITGEMTAPRLSLPNINKFSSALVVQYNDLVGAEVTRTTTYEKFLDGRPTADGSAIEQQDVFVIEQKVGLNKVYAEWELRVLADTGDRSVPGRICMKDLCPFAYRIWNAETEQFVYPRRMPCPYIHPTIFRTIDNEPTTDPALDKCDHTVAGGCSAREPGWPGGILLFGGYPGMSRYRM